MAALISSVSHRLSIRAHIVEVIDVVSAFISATLESENGQESWINIYEDISGEIDTERLERIMQSVVSM